MTITDWIEIAITFNTKCNERGKDVLPGKAFWSTSAHITDTHLRLWYLSEPNLK